jgi:hypothetical protein
MARKKKQEEDPMVEVKLTAKERHEAGVDLAKASHEFDQLEADWSVQRKEHRDAKKEIEGRMKRLSDEVLNGVRLEPAQTTLPA